MNYQNFRDDRNMGCCNRNFPPEMIFEDNEFFEEARFDRPNFNNGQHDKFDRNCCCDRDNKWSDKDRCEDRDWDNRRCCHNNCNHNCQRRRCCCWFFRCF